MIQSCVGVLDALGYEGVPIMLKNTQEHAILVVKDRIEVLRQAETRLEESLANRSYSNGVCERVVRCFKDSLQMMRSSISAKL